MIRHWLRGHFRLHAALTHNCTSGAPLAAGGSQTMRVYPVAALALMLCGCVRESKTEAKSVPAETPAVAVVRAAPADLSRDLEIAAEFRAYQEVELHAKVAGYLKQILVDVGDHVQAGQLLATLEIPEMEDELRQATAATRRSDAEVLRAKSDLARAEAGYAGVHASYSRLAAVVKARPNLVAQQELDDALARDRSAEAQVAASKAAVTAAEQQVHVSQTGEERLKTLATYARITAPFAGVITTRHAGAGTLIQAGTASNTQTLPVARLSQIDRLRLVLRVPESMVSSVRVGMPVEVRVAAPGRTLNGHVARFTGRLEPATHTMETEVDVNNPAGKARAIMPGMLATAVLHLGTRKAALAVPAAAVSRHDSSPWVLIVNDSGKIERRDLKLGIETPGKVEILSGLKAGEMVVVGGRGELRPGQSVEPKVVGAS
ncbi:MAG: efflux RND transporter periplasmic adaptor subunit [Bryobacterales bacterium]|nr:efflux RND transporter periplasmic adaptor subunit [Bryobacterales bacterium]